MHDIDRALFEAEAEAEAETDETYETNESSETHEAQWPGEAYEQDGSGRETALAGELLSVRSEAELDRFLGDLVARAVSAAGDFARSDAGRAVGGVLRSAARQALPQLAGAVGDPFGPVGGAAGGSGGPAGRRTGQRPAARRELGLQTEGLSAEDREYETARAFVRFAEETAQRAARGAATAPPATVAAQAARAAAARHLPGLVGAPGPRPSEGRWVRRGHHIVLLGV